MGRGKIEQIAYSHMDTVRILQRVFPKQRTLGSSWLSWTKAQKILIPSVKVKGKDSKRYSVKDIVLLVIIRDLLSIGVSAKTIKAQLPKLNKGHKDTINIALDMGSSVTSYLSCEVDYFVSWDLVEKAIEECTQ